MSEEKTKVKTPRVKRPKKSPIDIDINIQIDLRKIIDDNRAILLVNEERLRKLNSRLSREIMTLDVEFFTKVYNGIPLITPITIENYNNIKNPRFQVGDDDTGELCSIDLNYYSSRIDNYRITYSTNWNFNMELETKKIEYLNIVFKNFKEYYTDFIDVRSSITKKYNNLCAKIEVNEYYRKINDSESKLNKILDHLKFEPNLKYIFNNTVRVYHGTGRWDYYIKTLEIVETTPAYCKFNVYTDSKNDKPIELKKKKQVVLDLLKSNEYTFEKNIERSKKLERLILEA